MEKTLNLRGTTASFKPQIDENFVESQAKERFFEKKKKNQVSIKEKKNNRF